MSAIKAPFFDLTTFLAIYSIFLDFSPFCLFQIRSFLLLSNFADFLQLSLSYNFPKHAFTVTHTHTRAHIRGTPSRKQVAKSSLLSLYHTHRFSLTLSLSFSLFLSSLLVNIERVKEGKNSLPTKQLSKQRQDEC